MSYTLVGTGPTRVLFIPGMCTPGAMWEPQVAAFLAGGQVSMALVDNRMYFSAERGAARLGARGNYHDCAWRAGGGGEEGFARVGLALSMSGQALLAATVLGCRGVTAPCWRLPTPVSLCDMDGQLV